MMASLQTTLCLCSMPSSWERLQPRLGAQRPQNLSMRVCQADRELRVCDGYAAVREQARSHKVPGQPRHLWESALPTMASLQTTLCLCSMPSSWERLQPRLGAQRPQNLSMRVCQADRELRVCDGYAAVREQARSHKVPGQPRHLWESALPTMASLQTTLCLCSMPSSWERLQPRLGAQRPQNLSMRVCQADRELRVCDGYAAVRKQAPTDPAKSNSYVLLHEGWHSRMTDHCEGPSPTPSLHPRPRKT